MFTRVNRGAPDRAFALEHYRTAAADYDASCRRIEAKRARAAPGRELQRRLRGQAALLRRLPRLPEKIEPADARGRVGADPDRDAFP